MTIILTCPACTKAHHAPSFATDPHYCSIACYHIGQTLDRPKIPSCPDTVTSHPPAARRSAPTPAEPPPTVDTETPPHHRSSSREPSPRRPITVYECNTCGRRAVGEQRCTDCTTFMRRVGIGGSCPCCDEPIAIAELLAEEVITRR